MSTFDRLRWLWPLLLWASCARPEPGSPQAPVAPLPVAQPAPESPPRVAPAAEGRRLYAALCSSCHGADGRARTPLARRLAVPPQDLSRCNFKLRSTESGELPTDDDLARSIYVGLPGSAMPTFADTLPLASIRALVHQVQVRCPRFAEPDREAAQPLSLLEAPGAADASAARGRAVYRREGCPSCHGKQGRGDGPAAGSLRDVSGRPIRPRDHTRGVFRSGQLARDIYRAVSTGLDGTPMPALPAAVSPRDRWDLVRYIDSLSHDHPLWRALREPPTWYEPLSRRSPPWRR